MARAAAEQKQLDARQHHVGYYLIDDGLLLLEKSFNYRPYPVERARRIVLNRPTVFYLGMVMGITIGVLAVLLYYAYASGCFALHHVVNRAAGSDSGQRSCLSVVNCDVTGTFQPFQLPKMDTAARRARRRTNDGGDPYAVH
ncbi:MAG: hypothetical protein WKF84_00885 [Pyrinomonadaceae bacterium]